jgi:hypothetical protein
VGIDANLLIRNFHLDAKACRLMMTTFLQGADMPSYRLTRPTVAWTLPPPQPRPHPTSSAATHSNTQQHSPATKRQPPVKATHPGFPLRADCQHSGSEPLTARTGELPTGSWADTRACYFFSSGARELNLDGVAGLGGLNCPQPLQS